VARQRAPARREPLLTCTISPQPRHSELPRVSGSLEDFVELRVRSTTERRGAAQPGMYANTTWPKGGCGYGCCFGTPGPKPGRKYDTSIFDDVLSAGCSETEMH
jgi:hypothetical protein